MKKAGLSISFVLALISFTLIISFPARSVAGHIPASIQAVNALDIDGWKKVNSPGTVEEIVVHEGVAYARTNSDLYKSKNCASSWDALTINTTIVPETLYALDVTPGALYVATNLGALESNDFGDNFSYSLYWSWDPTRDIDFQDNSGWLVISSWGSKSGPNKKSNGSAWILQRGDIPWSDMSLNWVVTDPIDPDSIAYVGYGTSWKYRTLDGGEHWTPIPYQLIYSTVIDGSSAIFSSSMFSEDFGDTWQSLGITANAIVFDPHADLFYVAKSSGGVYYGYPDQWHFSGLGGKNIVSLDICGEYLLVVSDQGEIFRTSLVEDENKSVYLPLIARNYSILPEGEAFFIGQRSSSMCAEHDSYVVPLAIASNNRNLTAGFENTVQYNVKAKHPLTEIHPLNAPSSEWCDADWENCPTNSQKDQLAGTCSTPLTPDDTMTKVYDQCSAQEQIYVLDGAADIGTFNVSVNGVDHGQHTGVVFGSRWGNANSWNLDGVIYANGFTRWKPKGEEPGEQKDPCFSTSVILGPFQVAKPFLSDGYTPNPKRHPKIESIAISVCPHLNIQMSGAYYEGDRRLLEVNWSLERLNINSSEMLVSISQHYTANHDIPLFQVLGQYGLGQVGMSSMYADSERHDADTQIGPDQEIWVGDISNSNHGLWGQENQFHRISEGQSYCLETKTPTSHNTGSPTMCVLWGSSSND